MLKMYHYNITLQGNVVKCKIDHCYKEILYFSVALL